MNAIACPSGLRASADKCWLPTRPVPSGLIRAVGGDFHVGYCRAVRRRRSFIVMDGWRRRPRRRPRATRLFISKSDSPAHRHLRALYGGASHSTPIASATRRRFGADARAHCAALSRNLRYRSFARPRSSRPARRAAFRWPSWRADKPGDRVALAAPGYPAYRNILAALNLEADRPTPRPSLSADEARWKR